MPDVMVIAGSGVTGKTPVTFLWTLEARPCTAICTIYTVKRKNQGDKRFPAYIFDTFFTA